MKKILILSLLTIGMMGCKARTHNDSTTEAVETTIDFSRFPVSSCFTSGSLKFRVTIGLVSQEPPVVKNAIHRLSTETNPQGKDVPLKGLYLVNIQSKGIPPLTKKAGITTQTFKEDNVNILASFEVASNGSVVMRHRTSDDLNSEIRNYQIDGTDVDNLKTIDVWVNGNKYTVNNSAWRVEDSIALAVIDHKGFGFEGTYFNTRVERADCQ